MLVVDATVVVAALISKDGDGPWARQLLASDDLAAPHLMPIEVAAVLRRTWLAGDLSEDAATAAYYDFHDLRTELFAMDGLAERIWQLRHTVSPYDAWYVALAEALAAPLVTLDAKLARAPGTRCRFVVAGEVP